MKNSITIEALDTLFFKDGKPFSMGEESWAEGVFPPFPSVISGALRSVWFSQDMGQFKHANQDDDPSLKLVLDGYLPRLNGKTAFPAPLDLYGSPGEDDQKAHPFILSKRPESMISDNALPYFLKTQKPEKVKSLGGTAFLSRAEFEDYLEGNRTEFHYEKLSDYLSKEPKVGIGRDPDTRTASDGKLYRLNMNRLEGANGKTISFLLKTSGVELPGKGIMRIGAESRAAAYTSSEFPNLPCPVAPGAEHFKLYLATPAIFNEGAIPWSWLEAHGLRLLACANGRAVHIGGFDMVLGIPKPMRKAVPSGAVYYLAADNGLSAELIEILHQGSVYNLDPENDTEAADLRRQGFGLTYLGNVNL